MLCRLAVGEKDKAEAFFYFQTTLKTWLLKKDKVDAFSLGFGFVSHQAQFYHQNERKKEKRKQNEKVRNLYFLVTIKQILATKFFFSFVGSCLVFPLNPKG